MLAAFAGSSWFVGLPFDDQVQTSPGSIEMWFTFPSGNTADRELFDEKESPLGLVDDGLREW